MIRWHHFDLKKVDDSFVVRKNYVVSKSGTCVEFWYPSIRTYGAGHSRSENKKDKEHFEKIITTQNKIQKIKVDLNQLIQSMNNNPSWLSRAARFWNEIPLWQKITAGAVLTIPLLMIGIMANLAALITLSIVRPSAPELAPWCKNLKY